MRGQQRDEHAELQFAAAGHFEAVLVGALGDADRDIGFSFAIQAIADHAAGDLGTFAPRKRAVVDRELHGQRRRIDRLRLDRRLHRRIGDGVGHGCFLEARQRDDVARLGVIDRYAVEPVERQQLGRTTDFDDIAIRVECMDRVVDVELARLDASGEHAAHEIVAIEQRGEEAERRLGVEPGGGDVIHDQLEQRFEVALARVLIVAGVTVAAGRPQAREIELVVIRIEAGEQVEHFVEHCLRAGIAAVDLVDHHDRAQAQRQRLAGDKLGLRHRAFGAIDQQDDAVDHAQDTLHLAAEVGVAGGVDDVDPGGLVAVLPFDAGALGEDGDPAFLFEVAGVHRAFFHPLVFTEGAGLAEQLVDQRGLAVVDVGDDCDIAQGHGRGSLSGRETRAGRCCAAPLAALVRCSK